MSVADPPSSSSSLLEAVRNGDPNAWRRLTEIYGPLVYQWGQRAGLQAADAADILQQVFVSVFASIEGVHWDRPGDSFRGWLRTIFQSRLMDHYRQRRHQPGLIDDSHWIRGLADPNGLAESAASGDDSAAVIHRVLRVIQQDFRDTTWQAFWRSVVEGQPTSQIARDLNLTPAAVCMSRARVLRRIREMLSGSGLGFDEPA